MKQALIYNELVRFYNRSRRKLHTLAVEGKNLRKQNILQRRIKRLYKTLMGLQSALKLGMTTATLSAGMLLFQLNGAQAQVVFDVVQTNPFGLTVIDILSAPAFVDLDNDGDMDLMAGEFNGNFQYFQNTGTASAPAFGAVQTNPFGLTQSFFRSHPDFVDLDNDGDLDMMSGEATGNYKYFQNTGTPSAPAFAAVVTNPFGLIKSVYHVTPAFADLDNDGDQDLITGGNSFNFKYFENIGTAAAPAFGGMQTNPFGLTAVGYDTAPAFIDFGNDDDLDLMVGESFGNFMFFENTGTVAAPAFDTVQTNPFGLTDIGKYISPTFVDLDNDGDMDLMSGEFYGGFKYFEIAACNGRIVYADADDDFYGDAANDYFAEDCIVPGGYVLNSTDCDDANASIHPGATEIANGVDDNCNGIIDDVACPVPANLSVTNISSSSAKLNWDAVAGAEGYKIRYKVSGTDPWTLKYSNGNSKNLNNLSPNTNYTWEVKTYCTINPGFSSDWSGKEKFTTGALRIGDEAVQQVSFQIYPNPAADHATIRFTLSQPSHIYIKVHDVSGKEIATLLNGDMEQGDHSLLLNTDHFSKGIYVVRMIGGDGMENAKLIVQ